MTIRSIPALVMAALVAACSALPGPSLTPKDSALKTLASQQAIWVSKQVDDYTFTITRQCFCPNTDPLDITIAGRVVTSVQRAGQPVLPNEVQGIPKTIGELFTLVSAQAKAASLAVEWDPTFGFPTSIQVDSIANAIDDEFAYTITNFRPAS